MAIHIAEAEVTIAGRRLPLRRVKTIFEDQSLTKQSFTKDSDIRTILQKYVKTGVLGDPNRVPLYGDFTHTADDFVNSVNTVTEVRAWFDAQPAKVREHFQNDPLRCLEFVQKAENAQKAEEMGLKKKTEKPEVKPDPAGLETKPKVVTKEKTQKES